MAYPVGHKQASKGRAGVGRGEKGCNDRINPTYLPYEGTRP